MELSPLEVHQFGTWSLLNTSQTRYCLCQRRQVKLKIFNTMLLRTLTFFTTLYEPKT
jgi:hypothetical protein